MQLLVSNQEVRTAVIIAASATVFELKEKVAKQTTAKGKPTAYPAEQQVLLLNNEELADELSLAAQGVRDRDRIMLKLRLPEPQAGSAAPDGAASSELEHALTSLETVARALDGHEVQLQARQPVHQELFTRLLESLDGINLDGLSEEERALVRKQRKELVKRTEQVSEYARRLGGP